MPDLGSANMCKFRTAAKQTPRRSDSTVGQCPGRAVRAGSAGGRYLQTAL